MDDSKLVQLHSEIEPFGGEEEESAITWALYTYKFQCIEVVSKREEKEIFLGYHTLVSEISQMLGLCMPWNHMDYSILSETKSIPPSWTIIWRKCYGISLKGFHRGQMGWGHFRANNSFLSCSRSSILREHLGGANNSFM